MLKKIVNNFSWLIFDNISSLSIQFISAIILARLLTPNDYGVIGIITIFIAISNMIIDSGMGGSLIKKKNVTYIDYSTLFIYNIFVSLILYVILFFISKYVEEFYKITSLSDIIKVLSLVIIINAISIVQNIRLVKNLDFKKLAFCSFISNIVSSISAIGFAIHGYGIWSLVFQQLIQALIRTILLYKVDRFYPKLLFSVKSFSEQFSFGVNLLFSNILNTIYNNINYSIIGKINTPIQTGYYFQASKFQALPVGIVNAIIDKAIFPMLSQHISKDDILTRFSIYVRYTTILTYPFIFTISALSSSLLIVLLGANWAMSGDLLRILIFIGLGSILQYLNRNMLKSLGNTKLILKIDIINMFAGLMILLLTASRGVYYIATGVVISTIIGTFIQALYISKTIKYQLKAQVKNILTSLYISITNFIVLKSFLTLTNLTPILDLILGLLVSIIAITAGLVIFANKDFNLLIDKIKLK